MHSHVKRVGEVGDVRDDAIVLDDVICGEVMRALGDIGDIMRGFGKL